jgi:hypothetical protein
MKKLISIPAYLWAVMCFLLVPITFIQNGAFAKQLAKLPFMKVHPIYSGGELNRKYQEDSLFIAVNQPVKAALFNDSKQMVQVTFSTKGQLPEWIDQTIDYNFDASPDFEVVINTLNGETKLTPLSTTVKSLYASSKVKENWVIRVNLEK